MPRSTVSRRLRSLTVTLGTLTGLLLFRPVSADSGPSGIVADPSGRPLPGALVEWTGRGLSTLADSAGRFAFPDSPAPASAPDAPPVEGPGLALRLEGRQLHLEAGH
ncbi:MAG TPA: carboxypeptidase-like regulatory domain-containing protein, partial [Fibrobacteria bacterium]|nr:carboxypeptidase-like regulatory domain-containing protein [Fibrobacteria bacterium]